MKLLLVLLYTFSFIELSMAYETMTVHGYTSCKICHYSSTGGGLLNNYGKVISQEFSSFGETKEPTKRSLEHGVQFRYASFESGGEKRNFPMQADYLSAFKGESYSVQTTIAKTPRSRDGETAGEYLLRKLLVTFDYGKVRYELGRDYLVLGLNLVDHTLYVRSNNRRSVNDIVTVARGEINFNKHVVTPFIYLPSYQEASGNGEIGIGTRYDYQNADSQTALGISGLYGKTEEIKRKEIVFSAKQGFKKLLLMGQADFTSRVVGKSKAFGQEAYYLGLNYSLLDSLDLRVAKEKLSLEDPFYSEALRTSYSIKWKMHKYFSLQADQKKSDLNDNKYTIIQLYFNGWLI